MCRKQSEYAYNIDSIRRNIQLQSLWDLFIKADSVVKSKVQFEKDIAGILADCDEYEIRMVKDMAQALKETLRRDAHLRKQ